ncbi:serine hydrolase [Embleya sp. NPDC001921]
MLVTLTVVLWRPWETTSGADRGGPRVECSSNDRQLAASLSHHISRAVERHPGHIALAIHERTGSTTCTYDSARNFDSASIVKLTVLGALLRRAEDASRELTWEEQELATRMIEQSDNEATTELWHQLGVARISGFLDMIGATTTVPDRDGVWGLTQTSAADQIKLLTVLAHDNPVLREESRAKAAEMMSRVIESQRWGVTAGAHDNESAYLKNGWLQRSSGSWRVHSIGFFRGGRTDYSIAVLTEGKPTMQKSIQAIEAVSRVVHAELA